MIAIVGDETSADGRSSSATNTSRRAPRFEQRRSFGLPKHNCLNFYLVTGIKNIESVRQNQMKSLERERLEREAATTGGAANLRWTQD